MASVRPLGRLPLRCLCRPGLDRRPFRLAHRLPLPQTPASLALLCIRMPPRRRGILVRRPLLRRFPLLPQAHRIRKPFSSPFFLFVMFDPLFLIGRCLGDWMEQWNVWDNETAAWPVANPVVTCASATDAGFPSNFVADPFLYIQVSELELRIGDSDNYGLRAQRSSCLAIWGSSCDQLINRSILFHFRRRE